MLGSSRRVEGRDRRCTFSLCFSAPQNTKMVLQMVLRMENPPSLARSNLNWVQSMVSALEVLLGRVGAICSCLPGFQVPESGSNLLKEQRGLSWGGVRRRHGFRAKGQDAYPWILTLGFHITFMSSEYYYCFYFFQSLKNILKISIC